MKMIKITPELALTIKLLDNHDLCLFIRLLLDYAGGTRGIEPGDYGPTLEAALAYWFAHIDDITITEV